MAHSILEDLSEQSFTESTIKRMYGLIDRAKTDAEFQKLIYGLVNRAMPGQWKDYKRELSTVFNWFKKTVDYRRDPYGVELLQDVWATLDRKRADCDDATVFMGAAAEVLGSPARIVTVSTRPTKDPNHVYAEAQVGGRWLGLDATIPMSFVGWTPPVVTDRKIWSRKSLGLSGGEDEEQIEGLGNMKTRNGYGDDGFRTDMRPVAKFLAPGVASDISHTYGAPLPGTTDISGRRIWNAPVANNSDWTSNPRPGGGVYGPALPISKRPLPQDLWYLVDRKFVPKVLDPDSAWWGKVPTSREDLNRMFPGSEGTMATYLKDIASVPASAIAEVTDDVKTQLAMGEIGLADVGDAIQEGLEDLAMGRPPRMKLPPGQRAARRHVKGGKKISRQPYPAPPAERRYLVPAPGRDVIRLNGGTLNGLGDGLTDLANQVSSAIQTGQIPDNATSISAALDKAASVLLGKPAGAPITGAQVAKTAIPMGMLAALGLAAYLMTKGGGKKSYRRNPSRRRSRGGRRGGGFDMKTIALWGGGAAAAYFLLLRPGAPLLPSALAPKPSTSIPGVSSGQQAAIASAVKAAPGIFDSIAKLFGGGSSAPAPVTQGPTTGMITTYDQMFPAQVEQKSEFVTSL